MHLFLLEILECPACHHDLEWTIVESNEDRVETAKARCTICAATYPVRDGVGLFLAPGRQRNDLWEQAHSKLAQHVLERPDLQRKLLEAPLDTLAPADRYFRAVMLEERGDYAEAREAADSAAQGLYTREYTRCLRSQMDYVLEWLSATEGPIVDLASGRCSLVEQMLHSLTRPVVATDFSPRVLHAARHRLECFGQCDRLSVIALDARCTPFRSGSVATLTTNLGLANIKESGTLLEELRRIVTGAFLAICHFYPEEDDANGKVIREVGLEPLLYRRKALEHFAEAGWQVEVRNACTGKASPTPPSVLLDGAGIDGLPVADTTLEWCVLVGAGMALRSTGYAD